MYPYPILFGMTLYDICLTVGIVLVLFMADRMGIARGFSVKLQKTLIFSVIGAVIVGFLGAILFQAVYNAVESGSFTLDLQTGMTFYGGLIFGAVGFLAIWFIVGKILCKDDEPLRKFGGMADIAACLIPLAHAIGRIGCLTAGCCHGAPTDAWYGIPMYVGKDAAGNILPFEKFVPIQLFEGIFLFLLSGALLWLFFKKFGKENRGRFPLLPIYVVVYGVWRFVIEYFRADDRGATIVSFLTPSQLVAIVMILIGVGYFLFWLFSVRKNAGEEYMEYME